MIWEDSIYLWFLLAIPVLLGISWWYNRQLKSKRRALFGSELFHKLRRGFWPLGKKIQTTSLYVGLAFLIVAASGPKIGTEVREVKRQGVDLMIALDLSASMNAEDVQPSRLEKAKYEISRLIERLQGDRVGLIVFTGDAYLQSPMTLDYSALRLFLNIAETGQMPSSSTNFSAALETAAEAFDSENEKESSGEQAARVLMIVSDGENHGDPYDTALDQLRDINVSVYTLGIGTESGARIPIYDSSGSRLGFKRDNDGSEVITRLEAQILEEIANDGDGQYYEIRSGGTGIDPFLGRLDELQQGEFASQEYADYKNQYQLLGVIGLVFMLLSLFTPAYRKTSHPASD